MTSTHTKPSVEKRSVRDGELRVEGRVPRNLEHFAYHFPSSPVLPAYVQFEWLMEEVEVAFDIPTTPCTIRKVKFNEVFRPGDEFSLRADWDPTSRQLTFALHRDGQPAVSGIIEIESP